MSAQHDESPHPVPADLRVLIVDDRPLMRAGLASVLAADPLISDVLEAGSIEAAYAVIDSRELDVIIVSPDVEDPVEANRRFCAIASRSGTARVVCLSRDANAAPPACGRFSVVPETAAPQRFLSVIEHGERSEKGCAAQECACRHTHLAPQADLTAQESLVLAGLTDGLSNREIGAQLGLAEKTVKNYVTRIFSKLGVASRTAAIAALRDGVSGSLHH